MTAGRPLTTAEKALRPGMLFLQGAWGETSTGWSVVCGPPGTPPSLQGNGDTHSFYRAYGMVVLLLQNRSREAFIFEKALLVQRTKGEHLWAFLPQNVPETKRTLSWFTVSGLTGLDGAT